MNTPLIRGTLALAAVLALVFSMFPTMGAQSESEDQGLRVMVYNIHHGAGNDDCVDPEVPEGEIPEAECALDLERIAKVIQSEKPDIVALQEVDRSWARSGGVDQPKELSEMLDMEVCYGANLDHEPDEHADEPHQYGVATLSTYPIVSCENTHLPTPEGSEQRGLLDARVNVPGIGKVAVLNTHLDHQDQQIRADQVDAIVDYVSDIAAPIVLMGDFNAQPGDSELAPVESMFTDAWVTGGDGGNGYTYPASPDEEPDRRIDYIFVRDEFRVPEVYVVINEDTRMAADHFPLVAELIFTGAATPAATPAGN